MAPRLNRAGIPVLDPPGENRLPKRRPCLPDEHAWRTVFVECETDWLLGHTWKTVVSQCRRCGEKDEYVTRVGEE